MEILNISGDSMTDYKEFQIFLKLIGRDNWDKLFIIPLKKRSKVPDVRRGESWLKKKLTIRTAILRLMKGYNIGLVGKPSGFVFIDVDNTKNGNIKKLPETLTVTTNKGLHLYYYNKNITRNYRIGKNYEIDVRANNQYVVGVGSEVKKIYKIVNKVEPVEITLDDIKVLL